MSPKTQLPFNKPQAIGSELAYLEQAVRNAHLSGDGPFTRRCRDLLIGVTGAHEALLTHSCTGALEMAAILCDLQPGDEVIMPSWTFVSTANAVVLRGAVPVFVDVCADTLNIDPRLIEPAISERTRAIWPVHYAGVPADMDPILEIARRHELIVVEDAAQALGSTYRGIPAGVIGDLAALSFHETKNAISGEGGALLMRSREFVERAEIVREKGTNRKRFFRGEIDKYTWVDIGSSYLPGELVAAFLCAQLEKWRDINTDRLRTWSFYDEALSSFRGRGIVLPTIPDECTHNGHMYWLMLPNAASRTELIQSLLQKYAIPTVFHYVPLHSSPAGRSFGRTVGDMTHTDADGERLLRLPLYFGVGPDAQRVVDALNDELSLLLAAV